MTGRRRGALQARFGVQIVLGIALVLAGSVPARGQGSCGVSGDSAAHRPLYYTGTQRLVPPALGGTLFDLAYGCPVRRLTDDACGGNPPPGASKSSATHRAINSDGTLLMVHKASPTGTMIVDLEGRIVRANFGVFSWSEPRWSPTDPNRIYFHSNPADPSFDPGNPATYLNKVSAYDVAADATTELFTIAPYPRISFGGGPGGTGNEEPDLSPDGTHVVIGGKTDTDLFTPFTRFRLLNLMSGALGPEVIPSGAVGWCDVTPVTKNILCSARNASLGRDTLRLFDFAANPTNPPEQQILNFAGHGDLGVDTQDTNGDGMRDEIFVLINCCIARSKGNGCAPPGIEKIRLPDGRRSCILDPIATGAAHVSLNQALDANGAPTHSWALVSTYKGNGTQNPEGSLPANWSSLWSIYDNEILQVRLDGTEVRRLAHHRTRDDPAIPWDGVSIASIDQTGSLIAFNSNFAGSPGDVYLIDASATCNGDGDCDPGENCRSCPTDCEGSPSCGDGVCEAIEKEACTACPGDCNGVTSGNPANQFCCGPAIGPSGYCSEDTRCTTGGFSCTDDPLPGLTRCCGDGTCARGEGSAACQPDCGSGTAACPGGIFSGGSTVVCAQPREIFLDGPGSAGDNFVGIPAFSPVNDFPNDGTRNGFQQLCDIFGLRGTGSSILQFDAQNGTINTFLCNQALAPPFRPCQGVLIQPYGVTPPILGTIPVGAPGPGVEGSWLYRVYGDGIGVLGDNFFGIPLTIASLSPEVLCQELHLPPLSTVTQIVANPGLVNTHQCGQVPVYNLRPGEAVLIRAPGTPGQQVAEGSVTID
jgi:hypothetical protein